MSGGQWALVVFACVVCLAFLPIVVLALSGAIHRFTSWASAQGDLILNERRRCLDIVHYYTDGMHHRLFEVMVEEIESGRPPPRKNVAPRTVRVVSN